MATAITKKTTAAKIITVLAAITASVILPQIFHAIGKGLHIEGLAGQLVEVEGFGQFVNEQLFDLLQIVI